MKREKYEELRYEYIDATKYYSFFDPDEPSYRAILDCGIDVLPHLVEDLQDFRTSSPSLLLAAIRDLLGDRPQIPVDIRGRVEPMCDFYLEWVEDEGYNRFDELRPYRYSILSYSLSYLNLGSDRVAVGILFEPLDCGSEHFFMTRNTARMEALWPEQFDPNLYQKVVDGEYRQREIEVELSEVLGTNRVLSFEERVKKTDGYTTLRWSPVQEGYHPDLSRRFEDLKQRYFLRNDDEDRI